MTVKVEVNEPSLAGTASSAPGAQRGIPPDATKLFVAREEGLAQLRQQLRSRRWVCPLRRRAGARIRSWQSVLTVDSFTLPFNEI